MNIVFANAGINGIVAPIDEIEPEEWQQVLDVNLNGAFFTLKYTVPHLKRAGGGSIIIDASVQGTRIFSNVGRTAYGCTKAAQIAMMKLTAAELGEFGIRVNAVCPGPIESNISSSDNVRNIESLDVVKHVPGGYPPLTRGAAGKPHDIASVVCFLASDAAGFVTGTEMWVDGGTSLLKG